MSRLLNGCVRIVVVSLFFIVCARAEDRSSINIGFKFGHTFGDDGGFTVGAEISYTTLGEILDAGFSRAMMYAKSARSSISAPS